MRNLVRARIPAFVLFTVSLGISLPRAGDPATPTSGPDSAGGAQDSARAPAGWMERVQHDLEGQEYEVTWQTAPVAEGVEASWHAPNRAQGFRTYFTPEGIRVVPRTEGKPAWRWGLSSLGYGRAGTSWSVPQAAVSPSGKRVDYHRGAIQEWYENTPHGLKQGFVLPAPPEEAVGLWGARPLPSATPTRTRGRNLEPRDLVHVDLTLWGDLSPVVAADGQAIEFTTPAGARAVRYAELRVTDAGGRVLPAWMEGLAADGVRGIRLVVDARGAAYPVTIDPLATSPAWTAEGDQASAFFGRSVSTAGDVNGDGYGDVIVGALLYDNGQTDEGKAFLYLGSASGPALSPAWTAESDQASATFGSSVAAAGDVNGDGYGDVIVGADQYDNGQTDEGRAFVYLGSASGLAPSPAWTAESDKGAAQFGLSVSTAGDVNGDGYADVVVGAYHYDDPLGAEGRAFLYLGSASGPAASPAWMAGSGQFFARFGLSVSTAGDVNGDGYADVIVGADLYDNGQADEGRAYVYLGSASGLAASAAWTAESDQAGARFATSVATAGDVNGDGYADVIVGADQYDNGETEEGGAFVYLGSASGLAASPAWTAESDQASAFFGHSAATAGDVNGDGYADVIVGSSFYSNGQLQEGRGFVYLGSASGPSTSPAWTAESEQVGGQLGYSVATAGDVNGDGYSDVILGAYRYTNGQTNEGQALVYLGSASGPAASPAWTAESDKGSAQFGLSVSTAGDVNGDGYADVIVGAYHYDDPLGAEGRAFLYLGSGSGPASSPAWMAGSGQFFARYGLSVSTAGDVNGDGYDDVIVGADLYDNGQADEGRAYVYLGSASGLAASAAWTAESDQAGARFATSVATAGDVNGDGYADVIVGADQYDNGETEEGGAFVYLGSASGPASSPAWTAESDQAGAFFGHSAATAGDVNGDGYADVIVGSSFYSNGQLQEGRGFVYLGSASGPSTNPAWTAESEQVGGQLGYSVATAGDVNGDGYSDVILGAYRYTNGQTNEGQAVVYLGSASGLASSPAWTAEADQASAFFGRSAATAGDVNGDGYADVIVGALLYDNGQADEGKAFLYLGSASGPALSPAWTAESDQASATFGSSVATAGDVNGDGYADVIVGSDQYDNGQTDEGWAFLYYGNAAGLSRIPRQARSDGTTPIALWGKSDAQDSLRLRAEGRSPAGRARIRLEWEVEPLGSPFDGVGIVRSAAIDTGPPGVTGSSVGFNEAVTGLGGNFYHWRLRLSSEDPFFPRSPWFSLTGNSITETKLRTGGCLDRDGDGYGEMSDAACSGATIDCDDLDVDVWGTPGEVQDVAFLADAITLSWGAPTGGVGPSFVYDTLRSSARDNFVVADCVESDDGSDTTATDPSAPPIGQVFYYLARAQNSCPNGVGPLGTDSANTPRAGRACP